MDEDTITASPADGTQDFVQYWSAYQLLRRGDNPYDAQTMLSFQQGVLGASHTSAVMMWNPPWLLPILTPILSLDFESAALTFAILNVLLFLSSIILLLQVLRENDERRGSLSLRWLLLLTGFFYPAWDCVGSGQIGLLLCFAFVLQLYLFRVGREAASGACLAVLTIKPHLFYLLWLYWTITVFVKRRWSFAAGFVAAFALLICLNQLMFPSSVSWWANGILSGGDPIFTVPISEWQVETVIGWARAIAQGITGSSMPWLTIVGPAVFTIILLFVIFIKQEMLATRNYQTVVISLTCLSVATSPYGWFSDYSLLLAAHFLAIAQPFQSGAQKVAVISAAVGIQLLFLVSTYLGHDSHRLVFLMAFALMALALLGQHKRMFRQA